MSDLETIWGKLLEKLRIHFKKEPDINAILFLIGVQEFGNGFKDFTKEQKQDLIHIAICKILSFSGYYVLSGKDSEGWPIWDNLRSLPTLSLKEQESFLKNHILEYFSDVYDLN